MKEGAVTFPVSLQEPTQNPYSFLDTRVSQIETLPRRYFASEESEIFRSFLTHLDQVG